MTILPLPNGSSLIPGLEVSTPPSTGDLRSANAAVAAKLRVTVNRKRKNLAISLLRDKSLFPCQYSITVPTHQEIRLFQVSLSRKLPWTLSSISRNLFQGMVKER